MVGTPKKRARREAAEARAAGLAPVLPVDGTPSGATVPTVDAILARPEKRLVYSEKLAEKICELIALRVPLAAICDLPWAPCERTVYAWRRQHESFDKAITVARMHRAESRTDRIDQVIEDVRRGVLDPISARLVFDAERWLAGRENSARYADNSTQRVELTGANGGAINLSADNPAQAKEIARYYALIISNGERAARQIELQAGEFAEVPASEVGNG
jgi:hypothetical protein